jgi:hypothetical protein
VQQTARQMRAQPLRTAALLAIAASLAFFILWIASPGRPPVDSRLASSGSKPSGPASAPGTTTDGGSASSGAAASGTTSDGSKPSSLASAPAATAGGGSANSGTAGAGPGPRAAEPEAAPAATLTLRDAAGEVSLLANGELGGLEGLDASNRSAVAHALATGRLDMTPQIDALASSASVLRGTRTNATAPPALRLVKPLATAVRTTRPTFEWTAVPGAISYRVRIADAALNPVVESPPSTTTSWTPEAALPSGRILMWQVEAQTPQGAIVAPAPPASEARILVLRGPDAEALSRALTAANGSDLATAVALAHFGILDEADAALARLAAANPKADAIARLRQQLSDRRFPR